MTSRQFVQETDARLWKEYVPYLLRTLNWPNENNNKLLLFFYTKLIVFGLILGRGNWFVGNREKEETTKNVKKPGLNRIPSHSTRYNRCYYTALHDSARCGSLFHFRLSGMLPLISISVVKGQTLNGRNEPVEYNLTPCLATTEYDSSSALQTTAMKQTATCDPASLLCIHCNFADDGQRSTHNSDPQSALTGMNATLRHCQWYSSTDRAWVPTTVPQCTYILSGYNIIRRTTSNLWLKAFPCLILRQCYETAYDHGLREAECKVATRLFYGKMTHV